MHDSSRYRDRWWGFRQVFDSEAFIADAREVLNIPQTQFVRALDAAADATGFLDESSLAGTLSGVVELAQRDAVRNFISAFTNWRSTRAAKREPAVFLERVQHELAEALTEQEFQEADKETLAARVKAIWERPFPAVELAIKASRLVTDVGAKLDRIAIVCDLRPIFDESRTTVQGLIPITTLKLVSHGEDAAHPDTVEVQLTEKELDELHEKLSVAKTKVGALKEFVKKAGITLPSSSMTKPEESST